MFTSRTRFDTGPATWGSYDYRHVGTLGAHPLFSEALSGELALPGDPAHGAKVSVGQLACMAFECGQEVKHPTLTLPHTLVAERAYTHHPRGNGLAVTAMTVRQEVNHTLHGVQLEAGGSTLIIYHDYPGDENGLLMGAEPDQLEFLPLNYGRDVCETRLIVAAAATEVLAAQRQGVPGA